MPGRHRGLLIDLQRIDRSERRGEAALWAEFEAEQPREEVVEGDAVAEAVCALVAREGMVVGSAASS